MTSIGVLGPGGVGGFLAAALAHAGERVIVVAREQTAEHIARHGIHVRSVRLGQFRAKPDAVARLADRVDVLLIATKASGLEAGLERIDCERALVAPLLNGLDHMGRLRERFPGRVAAGSIRVEADRPAPGRIVHTSPFLRIDLAGEDAALRPGLEALAGTLVAADIPARLAGLGAERPWGK